VRSFHFDSTWDVAAPLARIHSVLNDLEHYPDWWPQVLAVARIDDDTARVLCRSVLPYTLDLVLGVVRREATVLETTIDGDLVGEVRWRLTPVDGGTRLDYEQDVDVTGRLARLAARPLGPMLRWNHERMMTGCRDGLKGRLAADDRDGRPG
jgi:carbon monoxide dehydrogenase subunit G